MKKIYTLILLTFLGISSAWALNAKIEGAEWKGNRSWSGEHVAFTMDAPDGSYDGIWKELDIVGNNINTITWVVDPGYILHITGMDFRIGKATTGACHFYINGADVGSTGLTTGKNFSYDQLSLGNDDQIEFKSEHNIDLYWIDITYTITPITYSVSFNGNGSTAGSMEAQAFTYDAAQNLSANVFAQNYTVSFDAKVTEVAALTAEYTFAGWAASAEGEKVYDDAQNVSNLTTQNGATIPLFALWQPVSVTLPAAEQEGYLFEGWFLNEEKIGEAGDVYLPTADVTLAARWTTFGTDELTITVGTNAVWHGIELKDSLVGEYTIVDTITNVFGGDSIVTLTLTVNKMAALEMEYPIEFCEGGSQEYRGVVYETAGSYQLDRIEGATRDTLITVVVTVNDKMLTTEYVEDTVGNTIELPAGEWKLGETVYTESYELKEADLEGLEFVQIGQTEKGCEAVTKLVVTVNKKKNQGGETTGLEQVNGGAKAVKEFRNGVLYIRRGERLFTAEGREVK